jgi:hypothetical protein
LEPRRYLFLLAIAGLAVRLAVAAGHEVITNDGASYLRLADNLATTGRYVGIQGDLELKFPPGYPLLVALAVGLGVPLVWAGHVVAALAGALLVFPAFSIGRRLGGQVTGWAAAVLGAFSPPLVWAGSLAIAEVVLALLVASALAVLLTAGVWRALAAGALLGCANLVKPEAFGFLFAGVIGVAVVNDRARPSAVAALLAGFTIVTGPWIAFLNAHVEPFLLEGKSGMYGSVCRRLGSGMPYDVAAAGLDAGGTAGPLVRFNESVGRFVYSRELLAAPREFMTCWVRNAERITDVAAREAYMHPLVLLCAAFGALRGLVAGGIATRSAALVVLAVALAVGHVVSGMVTMWIAPRYLLTALVLTTILAAHGLTAVRSLALPVPKGAGVPAAIAWSVLAVALAWWVPDLPQAFGEQLPTAERDVREAIVADAAGRHARVMSRFAVPSFYADADWVQTPLGDSLGVIRYARSQGVTHFVANASPQLAAIGQSPGAFGLRIVPMPRPAAGMAVFALETFDQAAAR